MRRKLILYLRYALQITSLVFFIYLFTDLVYPLGRRTALLMWYSRLDPWGLLSNLRWQHSFPVWGWLPLLILLITILFGRVFCGWFCPFGALLMLVDKVSRILINCRLQWNKRRDLNKRRHLNNGRQLNNRLQPNNKLFMKITSLKTKIVNRLQPIRYFWLLFLVITFFIGFSLAYTLTPFSLFSREIVRIMMGLVPWVLILIVIMTLLFSRLWCSVLCPTGILLSLFSRFRIFRYQVGDRCTHCSKCTKNCPAGTSPADTGSAKEGCLVCGECQNICPAKEVKFQPYFIKRSREEKAVESEIAVSDYKPSRRQFFKIAGTSLVAATVAFGGKTVLAAKKVLRPPGALPEDKFTSVCNRCGRCIKVCPNKALQPMPITDGIEYFDTPQIIPRESNCCLCMSCQEVCPTGAITKVTLEQVHIGKAELDKNRCLAWKDHKFCLICAEQCAFGAVKYDEQNRPYLLKENCIGCGTCERACAVEGEAAIRVRPE